MSSLLGRAGGSEGRRRARGVDEFKDVPNVEPIVRARVVESADE
jgi:hypothetical protein